MQNKVILKTFGFKYGIPRANYYFDVSFLKNPARKDEFSFFSKVDDDMRRFVLNQPDALSFVDNVVPLILFLSKVDQSQIFAIGCNAGQHRSRIVSELISEKLIASGLDVVIIHEDQI